MTKIDQYTSFLKTLLPPGRAWARASISTVSKFLEGLAAEMVRLDQRTGDLLLEADPRATAELLPEWERMLGLPDGCSGLAITLQERRAAILAKLITKGAISKQFFIDLAASLGFEITITEFRPFRAGHSCAGDALTNGDWVVAWRVNAPSQTVKYFRAGQSCAGEPLATWGNDVLECKISKRIPAGTIVLFAYGD